MSQLRLLLALRFKLAFRLHSARGRILSGILLLVTLVPMSILLAWGMSKWFQGMSPNLRNEALHFLYFAVFVVWVTSPLLGFRANEFFDSTKLFVFPVSHRTVFLATLLGSFTNGTLLFFLPSMVTATLTIREDLHPAGGGTVACRLLILLPALVLVAQTAIQCLTLGLLNLLRSRRFRDVTVILAAVFAALAYLGFRLFVERLGASQIVHFLSADLSRFLVVSPSYWISRAMIALPTEGVMGALSGLVPAAALTVALVVLGAWLQKKAYFGEIPFAQSPKREAARAKRESEQPSSHVLPDDVGAVCAKELRLLRREPAVKTQLISQASYLVIPIVLSIISPHRRHDDGDVSNSGAVVPFIFPGLLAALSLAESFLFLNLFGLEGPGINLLFSTPMPRRRIFFGKDVAYVGLFGAVNTLVLMVLSVVMKFVLGASWIETLSDFFVFSFLGLTLLVVLVSLGNVFSVLLPMRVVARGRRALSQQSVEREGCAKGVLRALSLVAVMIYLFPVVFLLILPRPPISLVGPWFYAVSVPVAIAYAAITWIISLRIGESLLAKRESRLLAFYTASPQ
ncbi:MAG: hypothetical protein HYR85_07680 [Planctomycetes bacterium]|nr:hypothetical protein [Planctomycetota bacterium]